MSRLAGLNCPELPETLSSCPGSSVIFALLLVEFTLLFSSSILVLLVLRDQIIHVGLGLSELHLIHTLTSVPVQEGLAAKQRWKKCIGKVPLVAMSSMSAMSSQKRPSIHSIHINSQLVDIGRGIMSA